MELLWDWSNSHDRVEVRREEGRGEEGRGGEGRGGEGRGRERRGEEGRGGEERGDGVKAWIEVVTAKRRGKESKQRREYFHRAGNELYTILIFMK